MPLANASNSREELAAGGRATRGWHAWRNVALLLEPAGDRAVRNRCRMSPREVCAYALFSPCATFATTSTGANCSPAQAPARWECQPAAAGEHVPLNLEEYFEALARKHCHPKAQKLLVQDAWNDYQPISKRDDDTWQRQNRPSLPCTVPSPQETTIRARLGCGIVGSRIASTVQS